MSCERWKESLVARLYDELAPHENERLSRHLESCEGCRRDLDELSEARGLLGQAEPVVPTTPRVVVLAPRPAVPRWMGFAAGFVCAALLGGAGLLVGWQLAAVTDELPVEVATETTTMPAPIEAQPATYEDFLALQRRIDEQDRQLRALTSTPTPQAVLTRQEFEGGLAQLQTDFDRRQADQMQFVLEELLGVEARNSARIGETQEALKYVVLANDPRVSAH
jgi:anti-sigma factor RsiW